MKSTTIILIFSLLLSINSIADNVQSVSKSTVYGEIKNMNGGTIWLLNFTGYSKYINVKDDGTFAETIEIEPGHYLMDLGKKKRTEIYFSGDDKIQINADIDSYLETLRLSGSNKSLNNYYVKKAVLDGMFFDELKELYALEANEFKAKLIADYKNVPLKWFTEVKNIPDNLRQLEQNHIHYTYLQKLGMYKWYHPRYAQKENFEMPEWMKKEVRDIPSESYDDMLYSTNYFLAITGKIQGNAFEIKEKDSISYDKAYLTTISDVKDSRIKDLLLFDRARKAMSTSKDKKGLLDMFIANSTNDVHKQEVKDLYAEMIKLAPGNPSPKFVNYENHAGGTSSLDDFKGKYVYVDIWATWCGPCKRQIPFLEKVEKQYHGKNIAFVTISVDSKKDKEKWRKLVTEKNMKGIQLIAPKAFDSEFIAAFNIQGIPRFILIDPQGNLVSTSAPMPSDEKLIELFKELGI